VAWDVYRIPVSFRIILPKTHPNYRKENTLFRDMLRQFKPPAWTRQVIVEGDAAYGAKANIELVKQLDRSDPSRHLNFVFAISKSWKTPEGNSVKDLVRHLPRQYYTRKVDPRHDLDTPDFELALPQNGLGLCQTPLSSRHWRCDLGAEQNRAQRQPWTHKILGDQSARCDRATSAMAVPIPMECRAHQ
jgi:hypothetical protein